MRTNREHFGRFVKTLLFFQSAFWEARPSITLDEVERIAI